MNRRTTFLKKESICFFNISSKNLNDERGIVILAISLLICKIDLLLRPFALVQVAQVGSDLHFLT
jgi:hypothetical protein